MMTKSATILETPIQVGSREGGEGGGAREGGEREGERGESRVGERVRWREEVMDGESKTKSKRRWRGKDRREGGKKEKTYCLRNTSLSLKLHLFFFLFITTPLFSLFSTFSLSNCAYLHCHRTVFLSML